MKVTRLRSTVKDERVITASPPLSDRVAERWSGRLNYYTGRTLTGNALDLEQRHRSGHLTMFGRQLSPGIAAGLELTVKRGEVLPAGSEPVAPSPLDTGSDDILERLFKKAIGHGADWNSTFFRWTVHLSPGLGLSAAGEDVTLSVPLTVDVEKLPVVGQAWDRTRPARGLGVLVLQPVTAEIIPRPATGSSPFPDTAVEWLLGADSESTDPCELDPADDPFADWQVLDGCRLGFFPWPSDWGPLPPVDSRFRNLLAYEIYGKEALAGEGNLPWEQLGVPLALVHISRAGTVTFADRAAVVRQGGSPLPRRPLFPGGGTPYLWQARIQGFYDHIQELRGNGLPWDTAAAAFRFLPPLGMLPADALSVESRRIELFPATYDLVAVPVPEEQVEAALEQTAALAPFDLEVADQVRLLVPVPQQFFEPRLLVKEAVDPIFDDTITELSTGLSSSLGRRRAYRDMAVAVNGVIDAQKVPSYPATDPAAVPGETEGSFTPDADHGYARQSRAILADLFGRLVSGKAPLRASELAAFDPDRLDDGSFLGLTPLIAELERRIALSDHAIDFGFLKIQTDIYRVRQVMLGNVQATRLATSSVLAGIAQGETSYANDQKLSNYFQEATSFRQSALVDSSGDGGGGGTAKAVGDAAAAGAGTTTGSGGTATAYLMAGRMNLKSNLLMKEDAAFSGRNEVVSVLDSTLVKATAAEAVKDDIIFKTPIIGEALDFRTTTIAERIKDPPAPEAKSYALATNAAILASLAELPINLDDIQVSVSAPNMLLMTREEFDKLFGSFDQPAIKRVIADRAQQSGDKVVLNVSPLTPREKEILGAELAKAVDQAFAVQRGKVHLPLTTAGLPNLVLSGVLYQNHPDGDEASFLGVGISALENAASILRKVEGRIKSYREVVALCRKTLEALTPIQTAWVRELTDTDLGVANLRHDLTVARALLAEEQARVNAINRRRADLLTEQVKVVFFTRQRSVTTSTNIPSVPLLGEYQDPVPACLAVTVHPPDELRQMAGLFRDVPLTWLPYSWPILLRLDRPELLREVYTYARERAGVRMAQPAQTATPTAGFANAYARAVSGVLENYQRSSLTLLQQKAGLDLRFFETGSWKQLRDRAQDELSLADLIESGRGSGILARQAARELEQIEHVAACFHARCGDLLPAVRLQWAELISVFDRPLSLRTLAALPAWDQVDSELRRDLQRLVDWLFGRVNDKIDAAVTLMNDLVRVCILMASHAPVSGIIDGHVPKPSRINVGDFLDLVIDRGRVGIGMQVAIHLNETVVAQGVVEDLSSGAARIQVTQAQSVNVEVHEGAVAKFYPAMEVSKPVR